MRILAINASPKGPKSNSLKLARAFVDGMKEEIPSLKEVWVDLDKENLQACRGCFGCWKATPGKCVIPDGMNGLLDEVVESDIILFSFPLYFFSVPSGMKAFIDRMLPLFEPFMEESVSGSHAARYDFSNKRFVFISTCGFYTAKGNYDHLISYIEKVFGQWNTEMIFCGQGELFSIPELKERTTAYLQDVEQAGREFALSGITQKTRDKLDELLYPREVFEEMADASWNVSRNGKKSSPAFGFTRQMAALYNPGSWKKDLVFTFDYTDSKESYQILLKKDGYEIKEGNTLPSDLVIHTPFTIWQQIAQGKMDGAGALMQGKYWIEGDLNYLTNWDSYFGSGSQEKEEEKGSPTIKAEHRKTNMVFLLFPWILFWTLPSLWSPQAYVFIPLIVVLELLFYTKFRFTGYDLSSLILVNFFCILSQTGMSLELVNAISYLVFGAMWTGSLVSKIPITAWYSANEYGGSKILNNPIFLQTNQILSAVWGVWYLIFGVILLLYPQGYGILSLVSYGMMVILGIFTAWFQKYWPDHLAKQKPVKS